MQHISPYNSLKTYEFQNWTGWKDMYRIYYKGCSKWILGHFQYQNVHTHFSTIKVIRGNKYKGSVTLWNVLNPCWTPCNRPWKCGNAVLLDILFQGKKKVILIFSAKEKLSTYILKVYVNETWKWACAILITFLALQLYKFCPGRIFFGFLENNNGNE